MCYVYNWDTGRAFSQSAAVEAGWCEPNLRLALGAREGSKGWNGWRKPYITAADCVSTADPWVEGATVGRVKSSRTEPIHCLSDLAGCVTTSRCCRSVALCTWNVTLRQVDNCESVCTVFTCVDKVISKTCLSQTWDCSYIHLYNLWVGYCINGAANRVKDVAVLVCGSAWECTSAAVEWVHLGDVNAIEAAIHGHCEPVVALVQDSTNRAVSAGQGAASGAANCGIVRTTNPDTIGA